MYMYILSYDDYIIILSLTMGVLWYVMNVDIYIFYLKIMDTNFFLKCSLKNIKICVK